MCAMSPAASPPARSVSQSWSLIDAWLARHAPASVPLLRPPAEPGGIAEAERELGLAFPADLVESLSCHDGFTEWAVILPFGELLSVRRIVEHWRMCMDVNEDVVYAEPPDEPWWHPLWIPWVENGGGDSGVIDMRPGPGQGRIGDAVHDDGGDFSMGWPSLAACLEEVAQVLYQGGEVHGWYPYLLDGSEMWWNPGPDDTELNGQRMVRAPIGLA